MKFEIDLQVIKDANLTQLVNDAKQNKLSTIPDSIVESVFTGKLFNYVRVKIQTNILGDKTDKNVNAVGGSFTWNPFQ